MKINQYGYSSNKISDYLSFGKPILAHVSEGFDHAVQSNIALVSTPGDIAQLAKNIRKLHDDKTSISKHMLHKNFMQETSN